jgi:hypothetical protein
VRVEMILSLWILFFGTYEPCREFLLCKKTALFGVFPMFVPSLSW